VSDRHARTALELFSDLTTAYVGIGALSTNPIFDEDPAVPDRTHDALVDAGAVGDIALRFFDEDGTPVHTPLDDQLIGITLEQLHATDCVVGVAGGPEKIDAIHGALRGQHVDVLITDHATATTIAERF
jgi:DNA-binding transcriptional regulator LsrR (DeoR family)